MCMIQHGTWVLFILILFDVILLARDGAGAGDLHCNMMWTLQRSAGKGMVLQEFKGL